jgi:hypothetical protein
MHHLPRPEIHETVRFLERIEELTEGSLDKPRQILCKALDNFNSDIALLARKISVRKYKEGNKS